MLPLEAEIKELALLDDIASISTRYKQRYGGNPTNLSDWNPRKSLVSGYGFSISPGTRDAINYIFSYEIDYAPELIRRFHADPALIGCLITHSGSSAIVSVCNWLRVKKCRNVLIVGPRYFTVPYCLNANGIKFEVKYVIRTDKGFSLPVDIDTSTYDAIWITNPVYCTSVYLDRDNVTSFASAYCRDKMIVIDECLADHQKLLNIGDKYSKQVCRIISPHKTICVNAMKFGAVLFPACEQEHFDTWSDVWHGCVPQSAYWAVEHFLSPTFEYAKLAFGKVIAQSFVAVKEIVAAFKTAEIDGTASGYLVTVYWPSIPANKGHDFNFLNEVIMQSGASFIPNIRNEMPSDVGFSFRVNLAAFDAEAQGALYRLCAWLDNFIVTHDPVS